MRPFCRTRPSPSASRRSSGAITPSSINHCARHRWQIHNLAQCPTAIGAAEGMLNPRRQSNVYKCTEQDNKWHRPHCGWRPLHDMGLRPFCKCTANLLDWAVVLGAGADDVRRAPAQRALRALQQCQQRRQPAYAAHVPAEADSWSQQRQRRQHLRLRYTGAAQGAAKAVVGVLKMLRSPTSAQPCSWTYRTSHTTVCGSSMATL